MELSKADSMATVNDVSTASDISDAHHPVSVSPSTLSAAAGRLSPQRSRLMKDQETVRGRHRGAACHTHNVCVCVCACARVCVCVRTHRCI